MQINLWKNHGLILVTALGTLIAWSFGPMNGVSDDVGPSIFPGRKGKFGFNLIAVCDHARRFNEIDRWYPGSTSDYIAFCTSDYLKKLKPEGFLIPSVCLCGDNSYLYTLFIVYYLKGISSGPKDAQFFFNPNFTLMLSALLEF